MHDILTPVERATVRRARELGLEPVAVEQDIDCDTCGHRFPAGSPVVPIGFDFDCVRCAVEDAEEGEA